MMHELTLDRDIRSFSISAENFTGAKGEGGKAELNAGRNVANASGPARDLGRGWKVNPYVLVSGKSRLVLADVRGMGAIRHIWITDGTNNATRLLVFRIYFDGHANPAVETPLSDFFCSADNNEYRQINSLAVCFNPRKGMNSYFEMPYRTGFRVEIENLADEDTFIYYQIDCEEKRIPDESLYFHAQYRRTPAVPYRTECVLLDGIRGRGKYVGTYLLWTPKSNGWWGEGEMKFYIDGDTDFPTICGTGTEDYFCGAYNFDVDGEYTEFSGPYTGLSKVSKTDGTYLTQRRFNMYRWHINDPIYFKKDLRVTVQALGWRSGGRYHSAPDDICSVTYWYSDNLDDVYPAFPDRDALELV